jgi:hypothetical protein
MRGNLKVNMACFHDKFARACFCDLFCSNGVPPGLYYSISSEWPWKMKNSNVASVLVKKHENCFYL